MPGAGKRHAGILLSKDTHSYYEWGLIKQWKIPLTMFLSLYDMETYYF